MKIIGLTGQSGAGKSTFSKILSEHNIPCLDTDKTARSVVEKGKPCLDELCEAFGNKILLADGSLDRKKLGGIAFSDEKKLAVLNKITHAFIAEEVNEWLKTQQKSAAFAAVIDAPQLFESGIDKICDITVAILADEEIRLERILGRDGITLDYAKKRIASQKSDLFFIENCDHIIYNNGTDEMLENECVGFMEKYGILHKEQQ